MSKRSPQSLSCRALGLSLAAFVACGGGDDDDDACEDCLPSTPVVTVSPAIPPDESEDTTVGGFTGVGGTFGDPTATGGQLGTGLAGTGGGLGTTFTTGGSFVGATGGSFGAFGTGGGLGTGGAFDAFATGGTFGTGNTSSFAGSAAFGGI